MLHIQLLQMNKCEHNADESAWALEICLGVQTVQVDQNSVWAHMHRNLTRYAASTRAARNIF